MWILKIKADVSKFLIGSNVMKHNIHLAGYPVSYFVRENYVELLGSMIVYGKEENKKAFLKDFKSNENILKIEINGDFIIALMKQPKETAILYNPDVIWLEPDQFSPDGIAIWKLGSFDREVLTKVVELAKKSFNGKLLYFKEEKLKGVSLMQVMPDLTNKQKKAMDLAVENGYYEVPKRIDVAKLAEIMKIAPSTYQVHLKRAEQKLLPFMIKKYKS